jgi:hypothetical protein
MGAKPEFTLVRERSPVTIHLFTADLSVAILRQQGVPGDDHSGEATATMESTTDYM